MGRSGGDVRITCTTEDMEVLVRECRAKESNMRVGSTGCLRGETVQQIHDGVEPLSPIVPRSEAWISNMRMTLLMVRIIRSALPFCGDV
jgi:hypothetical protein